VNVGLDYLRARYLSVGMGRFYGRDPADGVESDPRTFHGYMYADDDPMNRSDPSGGTSETGTVEEQAVVVAGIEALLAVSILRLGVETDIIARARSAVEPKRFIVDARTPTIAVNNANSQFAHPEWITLNYEPLLAPLRRRQALSGLPRPSPGFSWDEYPYASTWQGGRNSDVDEVPKSENDKQGNLLKQFYYGQGEYSRQGAVRYLEPFIVVVKYP
jgi:RHS repeat-associated protein